MSSRLILCEKTARWVTAFGAAGSVGCVKAAPRGRNAPSRKIEIIETRSIPGCEEALAASPTSFVAIEVTAVNVEATLSFLIRTASRFPRAALVALLSPDTQGAAPLFREAGAIDVAASVLEAPRLVRLAQRHQQQAPADALTPRQFVAECLPWPTHATNSTTTR
ncbi:MAG: hypothetical protein JF612_05455 [Planctomycetia bacterium]|nr:hypothetical protein [Planctomycetia bacterium]